MASTSAVEPSSESRNWLELPDEIMGGMILQRLGAIEILMSAQKVCTTWRRICKDPAMWKIICIKRSSSYSHDLILNTDYDIDELVKQAVHRSCGELIDISFDFFGTNYLVDYVSRCPSKLNSLHLKNCHGISGSYLIPALERLPDLETLDLFYIYIHAEDIEAIGWSCPHLKSFKIKRLTTKYDGDALAIANSMPALCHLQMSGSTMADDGLQAILNGCPHLESLDVRNCLFLKLGGNLEKLCRERIKDFKFTPPSEDRWLSPTVYSRNCQKIGVYFHQVYEFSDSDYDEFYEDYFLSIDDLDFEWL